MYNSNIHLTKDKDMKALLLITLISTSTMAQAVDKPYFTYGDPSLIIKMGGNPSAGAVNRVMHFELESNVCVSYHNCFNPFIVHIKSDGNENMGVGLDYVYRAFKTKGRDALRLSLGIVDFDKPIDNDNPITHIGASFEIITSNTFAFMLSADTYRTEDPINVLSLGFHWRH